jgi:GMP synthase (glutamine-hydrolysing)
MSQSNIHNDKILVLDFGSQYTQLIARRVREIGVFTEIYPCDVDDDFVRAYGAKGVILSGGPESAYAEDTLKAPQAVFELGVPVLGICYGMQTMAQQLGGNVEPADAHEYGHAKVRARGHTNLLKDIEDEVTPEGYGLLDVWMSHGDQVVTMPEGFKLMASTETCSIAGMADEIRRFYAVQFHPEVTHSKQGGRILERFVADICGCIKLWDTKHIIEDQILRVRELVGSDAVMLGLSGGVDSSVVAALLHKAIGDQLTCVFVDHGLLRHQEGDAVMAMFAQNMGIKVIRVDATEQFMSALAGESDPEAKRKIIGREFINVFEAQARAMAASGVKWLAQGTIYPDVIESAGTKNGKAKVIKSHHNVGGLPDDLAFKLVEPLRELFKDEVRKLGVELGLPYNMVYRHPFPGPGLGVRILGEIKQEYAEILRLADHIFIEELHKSGWYDKVSQAFVVFLPVKSVGVVGDFRRYDYVVSLRAVETIDFMTARWAHLPYELLEKVSGRIINEIPRISRVVYDVSSKPPATIEWE